MEDRLAWLDAELIRLQHKNRLAAEKRLAEVDPIEARREYKREWMRNARHPKPEPAPIPTRRIKIGNRWYVVKDLPLRDDQVAGDASKHEMAALATRAAQPRLAVPIGKRTMAPHKIDKRGKLTGA